MSGKSFYFCSVKMQVIISLLLLLFSHQLMTSAFPFPETDENFFPNLPDLPTSQDPSEEQVRYFFKNQTGIVETCFNIVVRFSFDF